MLRVTHADDEPTDGSTIKMCPRCGCTTIFTMGDWAAHSLESLNECELTEYQCDVGCDSFYA